MKESKSLETLNIVSWLGSSLLIGMGIYLGYILIDALFDKFETLDSTFYRIIFFIIIGAIGKHIYQSFEKET